jgi:hypothetical protein
MLKNIHSLGYPILNANDRSYWDINLPKPNPELKTDIIYKDSITPIEYIDKCKLMIGESSRFWNS